MDRASSAIACRGRGETVPAGTTGIGVSPMSKRGSEGAVNVAWVLTMISRDFSLLPSADFGDALGSGCGCAGGWADPAGLGGNGILAAFALPGGWR
jgi:hypothetical protein